MENYNQCKLEKITIESKELCKYGCGFIGQYKFKTVSGVCCSDYWTKCSAYKEFCNSLNKEYWDIFEKWNHCKIIIHYKLNEKMKKSIENALLDYSLSEILIAIVNYAEILESDNYFWTYEWTLKDFLNKGLDRFVEAANPKNNFKNKKKQSFVEKSVQKQIQDNTIGKRIRTKNRGIARNILKKLKLSDECLSEDNGEYLIGVDLSIIEEIATIIINKTKADYKIYFYHSVTPFFLAKIIMAILPDIPGLKLGEFYKRDEENYILYRNEKTKKWY